MSNNTIIDKEQIDLWYTKNTKLHKKSDLYKLYDYIMVKKIETKKINISNDYLFEFIDVQFNNIRFENIFKLNWLQICKKLTEYFPKINIEIMFEKASDIDKEIQKGNAAFKHDVYFRISNPENNKKYDCALEYFEEDGHKKRSIDSDKKLYVQQVVDDYIVYEEKSHNLAFYTLNTIHKIMLLICASCNDNYTLAKINFFKNNKSNSKKLKKQTEVFNKIIKFKKDGVFNFNDFYKQIRPVNPNTDELFKHDEFTDFLEENYDICANIDKNGNCKYNIFAQIIVKLDCSMISAKLEGYATIYIEAMDIIIDSGNEIIEYINKLQSKKEDLPEFLNTFLINHLKNYKKPFALKEAWENLNSIN